MRTLEEYNAELISLRGRLTRQLNRLIYLRVLITVAGIGSLAVAVFCLEEGSYGYAAFNFAAAVLNAWNYSKARDLQARTRELRAGIDKHLQEFPAELHQPQS